MTSARSHFGFLLSSGLWVFACIELNELPDNDDGAGGAAAGEQSRGGRAGAAGRDGGSGGQVPIAGADGGGGSSGANTDGGASAGEAGGGRGGSGGIAGEGTAGTDPTAGGGQASGGTSGAGGAGPLGGAGMGGEGAIGGDDGCLDYRINPEQPPQIVAISGDVGGVHDPVLIAEKGVYYLFHTGAGIDVKTSSDLQVWTDQESVFASNPTWIASAVPGAGDLWAPDISYFNDTYHLYYSASTFGSQRSCIGHATRAALDDAVGWTDHGAVVCSNPDGGTSDDWNAIDPNVILDDQNTPWLSFGSFWGGIKMIELDASGARANATLHSLAARTENERSVEAPFIVRRCEYYYLFVSFDFCCRGSGSTYRIMVGRSTNILGPYLDRSGVSLLDGGGTQVLAGNTRWRGPGHNAVLFDGYSAYNVYHSYDTLNFGRFALRISEMTWDVSGWPVSAGP
jgi:arabinan endo-1,5-alpha-L-arabinosidase